GGTAPYTGTGTFIQLAGAYSYTVTDANGCTATASGTISEPALVTVTASPSAILCNGGNSTVTVSAAGGTAPYTGTGTFSHLAGEIGSASSRESGCTATASGAISGPALL